MLPEAVSMMPLMVTDGILRGHNCRNNGEKEIRVSDDEDETETKRVTELA